MINQRQIVFGLILIGLVLLSHASFGHARFDPNGNVPGRTDQILKVGPCGGIARTGTNKMLTAGSQVRVDWQETVNHPGRYEFYLSTANDANFQLLATVEDVQNGTNDLPHQYSTMLQMPAGVTCENCTLQMIQVMTENPANPTYYYACADVKLQTAVMVTPSPLPMPAPAPSTASPGTGCH